MGRKRNRRKNKNKKRKGANMAAGFITSVYNKVVKKVPKPDTYVRYDKINVILHKQSDIEEIVAKAFESEAARDNEFQFHYWALQLIADERDSEKSFVITLPLVYFNFKQKVSGAHIDFHLDDVREVSEKVEPLAQEKAKEVLNLITPLYQYFKDQGYNVSVKIGEIGSVHRHPGAFGFSATDLKNDPENPGVIFRNRKAKDLYQVDSVLYIPKAYSSRYTYWSDNDDVSDQAKGAHLHVTECRFVNVDPVDENDETKGITGSYDKIPTILAWKESESESIGETRAITILENFLGINNSRPEESDIKLKTDMISLDEDSEAHQKIIDMVKPLFTYETVKIIVPDFIEEQVRSYYYGSYWDKNKKTEAKQELAEKKKDDSRGFYRGWDNSEWDDYSDVVVEDEKEDDYESWHAQLLNNNRYKK